MEGLSDADFIYELAMMMEPRYQPYIDRAYKVSEKLERLEALEKSLLEKNEQ